MLFRLLIPILAGGLLSGCVLTTPPVQTAPPPIEEPIAAALPEDALWWKAFKDPELDRLIEKAFRHNPDALQAVERIRQARAVLGERKSAGKPTLDLAVSSKETESVSGIRTTATSLGLSAGYEIDLWGKLEAAEDAARFLAEASESDLAAFYVTLAASVTTTYFDRAASRMELALLDERIETSTASLSWTRSRFEAGILSHTDLSQARTRKLALEGKRPGIEADIRIAGHALSVLTGNWAGAVDGNNTTLPELALSTPEGLPSEVIRNRPDVKAAWLRVEAADRNLAVSISNRFPSFRLTADLGRAWHSGTGPSLSATTWNLGAALAAPLLDWGKRKAEVERRDAALKEALAFWMKTANTGFREVADALVRLEAARTALQTQRTREAEAARDLVLHQNRYRLGVSGLETVLSAESRLQDATEARIAADRNRLSQQIALARSIGGAWSLDAAALAAQNAAPSATIHED